MDRKCTKCSKIKPIEDFTKLARGKEGRRSQCKACDKDYRVKHKKPVMPRDGEAFKLDTDTVHNHFYIHFGFTEYRYNPSEWSERAKYIIDKTITTTTKNNKL